MPNIIASMLMLMAYTISIPLLHDMEGFSLWVVVAGMGMALSAIALFGQVRTYLANNP